MSTLIKRLVPTVSGAFQVLRTRAPAVLSVRGYSEGSTARDPGWSKKEKAVEDQYAHNREMESIKKMKKELETRKAELEQREKELLKETKK